MIKNFFFFILFLLIHNPSYASIKEKIIENLKQTDNLSFKFKQTIDGKDETGNCVIEYPKKIYCEYKLKNKKILVSNGKSLIIKKDNNPQYYRYSLKKTPLNLILDKKFLLKKITKSKINIIDEKYYNFVIEEENNIINLYFNIKNYNLIGWQTEDIYQNLVVTYIYDLKINQNIDEELFNLNNIIN